MIQRLLTDTDILIDYLRGYSEAVAYIENTSELLFISVITVAELYAGIRNKRELIQVENFLRAFEKVPLDESIAVKGGLYRRDYGKSHGVGLPDALIAATAEIRQAILVTLNRKHFPMLTNVIVPYKKEYPCF